MPQTASSCARDWDLYSMPEFIPEMPHRTHTVKKTVYKVNHKRKLYIKSACMVFGYALILVFLCMKSATLGYQIEKLEVDVQNLETANHRLDYQIAEKSSLNRVEWVAVSQLGMYKPNSRDSKASVAMAVKTEPIKVASTSAISREPESISQRLFNRMFSSLSRLAQNNN